MKNLFWKNIIVYSLISLSLINLQGCYTITQGDFIRSERIYGSEKEKSSTILFNIEKEPTTDNPTLILRLMKKPKYEVTYVKKYEEKKTVKPIFFYILLGGGLLFGLGLKSDEKSTAYIGLSAIVIGFAPFLTLANSNNEVDGEKEYKIEEGKVINLGGSYKFTIRNNYVSKDFYLDGGSKIQLDLIKDLDLDELKQSEIQLIIENKELNFKDHINLKSSQWLIPYIKINKSDVSVKTEKSESTIDIGIAKVNEVYPILYQGELLVKIKYQNQEGFVPTNSGEVFWKR